MYGKLRRHCPYVIKVRGEEKVVFICLYMYMYTFYCINRTWLSDVFFRCPPSEGYNFLYEDWSVA